MRDELITHTRARARAWADHHHHTESAIARKLVSLFEIQDPAVASTDALLHKFDARRPPKISLDEYIKRMVHYLTNIAFTERKTHHDDHVHSDLACRYLITARMLVGRVQQTKGLVLTPLNVHRFIIVGLLLASKILDDLDIGVAFFALLGGVDAAELVTLESVFLDLVAYNLAVDERDFRRIYQSVLGQGDRMMSEDALDHCSIYSPLLEHDGVPPSIANEV